MSLRQRSTEFGGGTSHVIDGRISTPHAFLCYVHEDARKVMRLRERLKAAGIPVWQDASDLWPGEDWRAKIRQAIRDDSLVFIACFSKNSAKRARSYQNEELCCAVEEAHLRSFDATWLIPVRFNECSIPDLDLGAGRRLNGLHRADLFGLGREAATDRLVATVIRALSQDGGIGASYPARKTRRVSRWVERSVAAAVAVVVVGAAGFLSNSVFGGQGLFRSQQQTPHGAGDRRNGQNGLDRQPLSSLVIRSGKPGISNGTIRIFVGQSARLILNGSLADGQTAPPSALAHARWVVTHPVLAKVSSLGQVTGLSPGVTRVTVRDGSLRAYVVVRVIRRVPTPSVDSFPANQETQEGRYSGPVNSPTSGTSSNSSQSPKPTGGSSGSLNSLVP